MLRFALVLLVLSACTRTATVERFRQPSYEARIVDGDRDAVIVVDEQGGRHRVPRSEIVSIDHPGNGLAVVGAVLLFMGGALVHDNFLDRDEESDDETRDGYWAGGFYLGLGGVMALAGGLNWWRSTSGAGRLDPPVDPRPGVQAPVLDPYAPRF